MCTRVRTGQVGLMILAAAVLTLRADTGDVENSRDYPGFPRLAGFIITDYDEDNPAEFNFPVARPMPMDADHVENVLVKGHRYVIHYEMGPFGQPPSLLQTQLYYEKLAAAAGMKMDKSGAVGDVSETFHGVQKGHELWMHLDPSVSVNVLTFVESKEKVPVPSAPSPPAPASPPTNAPPANSPTVAEDPLYNALMKKGRVVLPLTFLPGKPDLDADSEPVIRRVVAMMKRHPELQLYVVGHTDNSGDVQDNQHLSERRAETVRGLLIAEHVEKNRLVAEGRGGSQPLADEKTAEGRDTNRRIELVLPSAPAADGSDGDGFHTPAPDGVNYYPAGKGAL